MNAVYRKFSLPFSAFVFFCGALLLGSGIARAGATTDAVMELQHAWAKAYYQVPEKQKEDAFKELAAKGGKMKYITLDGKPSVKDVTAELVSKL